MWINSFDSAMRSGRRTPSPADGTAIFEFFAEGDLGIPRRYGARWLVVDRSRFDLELELPVTQSHGRYALYRLPLGSDP